MDHFVLPLCAHTLSNSTHRMLVYARIKLQAQASTMRLWSIARFLILSGSGIPKCPGFTSGACLNVKDSMDHNRQT
jgi:hypothetical protein